MSLGPGLLRQARDYRDVVAARRQVLGEPSGVRADPGRLRAVVDADDEDAHPASPWPGDQPGLSVSVAEAVAAGGIGFAAPFGPAFAAASAPYAP